MLNVNQKYGIIYGIIFVAVVALLLIDPISQDLSYHNFADQRIWLGIPNFANVISNALFLVVGVWGMIKTSQTSMAGGLPALRKTYFTIFLGIFLTGFGSAFYHWQPNNITLVWDRLPMAIAFMALFAMVIGEQVSIELAQKVFGPLIVFGIFSIAYWHFTEQQGLGDLRIYLLVQFLPILLIPLLLLFFNSPFTRSTSIWLAILFYGLAKACELGDQPLFDLGLSVSGHSLKHLFAAFGGASLVWGFYNRRLKNPSDD